jgi:hypothetical protein
MELVITRSQGFSIPNKKVLSPSVAFRVKEIRAESFTPNNSAIFSRVSNNILSAVMDSECADLPGLAPIVVMYDCTASYTAWGFGNVVAALSQYIILIFVLFYQFFL